MFSQEVLAVEILYHEKRTLSSFPCYSQQDGCSPVFRETLTGVKTSLFLICEKMGVLQWLSHQKNSDPVRRQTLIFLPLFYVEVLHFSVTDRTRKLASHCNPSRYRRRCTLFCNDCSVNSPTTFETMIPCRLIKKVSGTAETP